MSSNHVQQPIPGAGASIAAAIRTAEITFRGGNDAILFTQHIGQVRTGDTITWKVPEAQPKG